MDLYIISRKIHRIAALIIAVFILLMAGTGVTLKYNAFVAVSLPSINLGLMRYLHNNLSPWFAIALTTMMMSGLIMYFYPLVRRKKIQDTASTISNNDQP